MPPAVPLKFPALVKQAQDSKGNAHCRFVRLCWVGSLHSGREALELPGLLELGGMQMSFISLSPWLAALGAGMAPPTTFEWPLKMGCVVPFRVSRSQVLLPSPLYRGENGVPVWPWL